MSKNAQFALEKWTVLELEAMYQLGLFESKANKNY